MQDLIIKPLRKAKFIYDPNEKSLHIGVYQPLGKEVFVKIGRTEMVSLGRFIYRLLNKKV